VSQGEAAAVVQTTAASSSIMALPTSTRLSHRTIFCDEQQVTVQLPFTPALRQHHEQGVFHLLADPNVTRKTSIVGMFVLRPAHVAWKEEEEEEEEEEEKKGEDREDLRSSSSSTRGGASLEEKETVDAGIESQRQMRSTSSSSSRWLSSMFAVEQWVYNYLYPHLAGGGTISQGNVLDGYRLALQYGLCDCVLVGSNTVSLEGCGDAAYLWQSYAIASWPHIQQHEPLLFEKLQENRRLWQEQGFLSSRKYPCVVVVTTSGKHFEGSKDFLEAKIFSHTHPCGEEQQECYILTSIDGAEQIRVRAEKRGFTSAQLEKMLLVASPLDKPSEIDVALVPELLFSRLGVKLANHDGGHKVLRDFFAAGALCQMNITLCRNTSMRQEPRLSSHEAEIFDSSSQLFFAKKNNGKIPPCLKPVAMITDRDSEVAVVTFDARGGGVDFFAKE